MLKLLDIASAPDAGRLLSVSDHTDPVVKPKEYGPLTTDPRTSDLHFGTRHLPTRSRTRSV